jgi:hypothetical protein
MALGLRQWLTRVHALDASGQAAPDWVTGLAERPDGSVALLGFSIGGSSIARSFLAGISDGGDILWQRFTSDHDYKSASGQQAFGMAMLESGEVISAGYEYGGYNGTGESAYTLPLRINPTPAEEMGGPVRPGIWDGVLIWHDLSGLPIRRRWIGSERLEQINGVAVGASGTIVAAGWTDGSVSSKSAGGYDLLVQRISSSGATLWSRQLGGIGHDRPTAVATTSDNGILVVGHTKSSFAGLTNTGEEDAFLLRLDADGEVLWARSISTPGPDHTYGVHVVPDGDILITGRMAGPDWNFVGGDLGDVFLARYSPAGNLRWLRRFGSSAYEYGRSIAVTASGDILVSGRTEGNFQGLANQGGFDGFVSRFAADGSHRISSLYGTSGNDAVNQLLALSNGDLVVAGMSEGDLDGFGNTSGSYDVFAERLTLANEEVSNLSIQPIPYVQTFSANPASDPLVHGTLSGSNATTAWQGADQVLRLDPGVSWRTPAFAIDPLGYVKLSFRAKLLPGTESSDIISSAFNRNHVAFQSINRDATWNLDPLSSGTSGGDLIAAENTSLLSLSDQWTEQVFYSRAQANAAQISVVLSGSGSGYFVDDVQLETVSNRTDVAMWADTVWDQRFRADVTAVPPELTTTFSSEQQHRLARTLAKLQAGEHVRIVVCGDSIINDLANSAFDVLLERAFPGSSVSVITAVGSGAGMDEWNPVNFSYPFISNASQGGSLNFNEAIIEQQPDLVILGGISTPANQAGYTALEQVIAKLQSESVANLLGHRPDILISTGAFGTIAQFWNPSVYLTGSQNSYRGNLLRIANAANVAFMDQAKIWGDYLLAALNSANPLAIGSTSSRLNYWRDNIHANTFGKQILGRSLVDFLSQAGTSNADLPRVNLSVTQEPLNEDGSTSLIYTFTRSGSVDDSLTVFFTVDGTASPGNDYSGLGPAGNPFQVTIPAGSSTALITIDPVADVTVEADETVIFELDSTTGLGYVIATDTAVSGIIRNDDFKLATINTISDNVGTVQGAIAEGAVANDSTPTLSGSLSAPLASGEKLAIYRNGSFAAHASVSSTGWSYTSAAISGNGSQSFTAAVVDGAGNLGPLSAARSFLLDTSSETSWTYDWAAAASLGSTPGVLLAQLSLPSPRPGEPHLQVTALRADLTTPGLSLATTGRISDWQSNSRETLTQTTRGFITDAQQRGTPMVAAINTAFFDLSDGGQSVPTDLKGLAVNNGVLVSPVDTSYPSFLYDPVTGARIVDFKTALAPSPESLTVATSGLANQGIILREGVPSGDNITQNSRSAIGLSQDARYMIWLTVDRSLKDVLPTPSYYGATIYDSARLLAGFGSHVGLSADGGGSTQIARWDEVSGTAALLNNPLGNLERFVGSNLGITYQPPLTP